MSSITLLDYVLLPFALGFVYLIAYYIRSRKYPPRHPWRKYYISGLSVKLFCAVFNGMLHYYYYGGGDTFAFFYHSQVINSSFSSSVIDWFNLMLHLPNQFDINYYRYTSLMYFYGDPASYTVGAIGALFSLLTFNTYLPTAVFFAFLSYSGIWAMFRTFAGLYPRLVNPIAVTTLFIPTVAFWGSAVYKDTLCMFGLGWLVHGIFRFMIQKDFSSRNIILMIVSFFIISIVKIYILIAFIPALGMWILFNYTQKIRNSLYRYMIKATAFLFVAFGSVFLMSVYSKQLGSYSLENIAGKAEETRNWITYASETQGGSAYNLGDLDPSLTGMLLKFPQAVNVTLFRPYFWEAKKIIMIISAIESALFLLLTVRVFYLIGLRTAWRTISKDPTLQFCLIFAIIFAFAVGVTTYNFGSLSRYKIPCLPFYATAMVLIFYKNQPLNKKILPPFF